MSDQPIQLKRIRGLATIILNRPERLNALNQDLIVSLRQTLEAVASDNNVRVVCLTGSGRAFCAGQDLTERDPRIHKHPFDLEAIQKSMYHPVIRLLTEMPKPVVAKVNGLAAGAGASLALASDIAIVASSATFSFSFVKVGLSVDAGGGWTLSQALGPARARAILMLGEEISATTAEALGLIYCCVEDEDLDDTVETVLDKLVSSPRVRWHLSNKRSAPRRHNRILKTFCNRKRNCRVKPDAVPIMPKEFWPFSKKGNRTSGRMSKLKDEES